MKHEHALFRLFLGFSLTLAMGSGCKISETDTTGGSGGGGNGGDGGNGGGGSGGGDTWVSTTGPEHCGTITKDEVWAADRNPHIVTCDVLLEGGNLRIGPGTEVLFADDTGIHVSAEGARSDLEVAGDEGKPVAFRGQQGDAPGQWTGVVVAKGAGAVSLRHLTIESAGGFDTTAALDIESVDVHAEHLTLRDADELGLYAHEFGGLDDTSTALVITGSTGYPALVDPERADSLPSEDSKYTGNATDMIRVEGDWSSHKEIRKPHTWEDLGVPYLAATSLSLNGTAGEPAVLTILDGVTILFDEQSELKGGFDGAAGIVTKGTADRPVVLTSANGMVRGAWAGIKASDNMSEPDFQLEHTIIDFGGGFNNTACLTLVSTSVLVKNVTLKSCDGLGFDLQEQSFFQDGSAGLVVTDSPLPGQIMVSQAHTLPEEGIALAGNDDTAVLTTRGNLVPIVGEVVWGDIGATYRADKGILLAGTAAQPSILELVPGLRIELGEDGFVTVGKGGAGALRAKGTAAAPIVFTGADAADPGAWGAIDIDDLSIDAETILDNVLVEYGGGKNTLANIEITAASPTISNARIENSDEWGIYLWQEASPSLTNVTFAGNAAGDVGPEP